MAISKGFALVCMIVGAALCFPFVGVMMTYTSYIFLPILMATVGAPMFFVGLVNCLSSGRGYRSSVESDLARVRFVEETKLRGGK